MDLDQCERTSLLSSSTTHLVILPLRPENQTEVLPLRHVLILMPLQPPVRSGPVHCQVCHPPPSQSRTAP